MSDVLIGIGRLLDAAAIVLSVHL